MKINKNIIKELNDYLEEFNLAEIEYTEKDVKVKVSKSLSNKNLETSNHTFTKVGTDVSKFLFVKDFETFTFKSFSVYSISVRLNSSK